MDVLFFSTDPLPDPEGVLPGHVTTDLVGLREGHTGRKGDDLDTYWAPVSDGERKGYCLNLDPCTVQEFLIYEGLRDLTQTTSSGVTDLLLRFLDFP